MPRRSDARRTALQMLYLMDVNPEAPVQQIEESIAELSKRDLIEFATHIVQGVRGSLSDIDRQIETIADNWRIERMAPTDRNVMRLAVYEMQQLSTPAAVAINEAIDLAREFGTENSAKFVNGILDRLTVPPGESGTDG